jgi:hypothetical protein
LKTALRNVLMRSGYFALAFRPCDCIEPVAMLPNQKTRQEVGEMFSEILNAIHPVFARRFTLDLLRKTIPRLTQLDLIVTTSIVGWGNLEREVLCGK